MRNQKKLFWSVCICLVAITGCGSKEESSAPAPKTVQPVVPTAAAAATGAVAIMGTSTLRGKVSFSGVAPAPLKINMAADPYCASASATVVVMAEDLVVNSNQTLRNAFVYIKSGLEGKTFTPPLVPVTLEQKGCRYAPHIFGIQTGQPLEILNDDSTLHNVHGILQASPPFNLGMPLKGMKVKKTFAAAEVMVKFKCDVHPWMSAYVGVVAHPFYAVTGEDGSFELKGVPAGKYTLAVWHEKLGVQEVAVDVPAAGEATVEVMFKGEST